MKPRNCLDCWDYTRADGLRCGACSEHKHDLCRVALTQGNTSGRGRGVKARTGTGPKGGGSKGPPVVWRCKCACGFAKQSMCPDCRRVDVELDSGGWCVDREVCGVIQRTVELVRLELEEKR